MAIDTDLTLRNQVLYCIYVRNFTPEGTFAAAERELPRVRALGADVVWLMPIHPTGQAARIGALGSPYAIADYRAVNPEFGTLEDFRRFADRAHQLGMKLMIDVVYNHTSPDSWLATHHPEWFYHKPDGSLGNHVGEWPDVADLDYSHRELWDYQIETLCQWAEIVDGFRCDVAPLVPLEFWLRARREVAAVRPGCLWLCESVEPVFTKANRDAGVTSLSDSELYQAFDVSYDYDIYGDFADYVQGKAALADYVRALERQETSYPANYVKLRFLENHDRPRAAFLFPEENAWRSWTAWLFFQKGLTLLYAGQERRETHRPSLFERDPISREPDAETERLLIKLAALKRDSLFAEGAYSLKALPRDLLLARYASDAGALLGAFSLKGTPSCAECGLPEGVYRDLLNDRDVRVESGLLACDGRPMILRVR